jgi:hypothetical protein
MFSLRCPLYFWDLEERRVSISVISLRKIPRLEGGQPLLTAVEEGPWHPAIPTLNNLDQALCPL